MAATKPESFPFVKNLEETECMNWWMNQTEPVFEITILTLPYQLGYLSILA